jgi:1,4-dihydroxy-2-naphthoate polyprenyltransferase
VATATQWIDGARLRTLAISIAPVLIGTAAAVDIDAAVWWKALVALVVSFFLQVGINYANDYSDGIRGTDDVRIGPQRLVGSGAATPGAVKRAAFVCFGVAGAAGLALALTTAWWLVLVGAACVAAAWFYTGGSHPYGYLGLGEIFVFVFFGLVATIGTTFVQAQRVTLGSVLGAIAAGLLACAVLVANNLRDIPTDAEVGKRTLSVRLGDRASRLLYIGFVILAFILVIVVALAWTPWALLGLAGLALAVAPVRIVVSGAGGMALIPVLKFTGFAELAMGGGLLLGAVLGSLGS